MATKDINELLADLRLREATARTSGRQNSLAEADRFARQIMAVEELQSFKARHLLACDCLARAEAACEPENNTDV